MKNDIDQRVIECIEYLVRNKRYKSERDYLLILGLPLNKLSDARKGKASFRAEDIGIILMKDEMLNGHWIMTGKGSMLLSEDNLTENSFFIQKYNQLEKENGELREEVGKLKEKIHQMKNEYTSIGMVAESAEVKPYNLNK